MVELFGYKLKLVKKADIQELKVFKIAVNSLYKKIDDFGAFLSQPTGFDLNRETSTILTEFNDSIGIYVDMYFSNKYSLPSNSLALYKNMDVVRRNTLIIIDAIVEYHKLESVKAKYMESCDEFGDDYMNSQQAMAVLAGIQEGYNGVTTTIGKAVAVSMNALLLMHHSVSGDKIRIDSGVDFEKEYKKRLKRIPKDKDLMSEFTVKFMLNTRSDNEYLLKEKVKNEQRSRARTSDGRSEKAV